VGAGKSRLVRVFWRRGQSRKKGLTAFVDLYYKTVFGYKTLQDVKFLILVKR